MAFELREILDTVQMIEVEHFDIRTVTLGLSLRDCASRLPATAQARVYDKIRRTASQHVRVAEEVSARYGVRIVNKRISVTPAAMIMDGASVSDFVGLAQTLDQAAADVQVDFVAGFSALVEKGFTPGDTALIESLPQAMSVTERVCASVNCGSTSAGINVDAVNRMSEVLLRTARLTADRDSIGCARIVAFCNAVHDNPFVAGAFHGPAEGDAVINVGISGPGVVLRTVRDLAADTPLDDVAEAIKRTAFKITRAGELVGRECAKRLAAVSGADIRFGVVDLSLAPTPQEGDSIGDILIAMGLEDVGAAGSTAALALLTDAVKKGGLMASSRVGGLSGAFIPVSEDQAMIRAVERNHISIEKLEAMTSVCSVGLDMIAIPGDTPAENIAGVMLDEFAIGMMNRKTTSARLIPVFGKSVGDRADFGGLLGTAPVMALPTLNSAALVRRGGRIPAPTHSLRN